ncbi:delta-aminolevulinic acid dehydratase [Luminiphilus sp.]|nr:delta-aminolevulinic acid dehydratase [Luminiphilus sp.]MDB2378111.1 delta-aminolevulinic acid dehydratase [Luminiphilus sp.]MDB2511666.1 delta-aminolevulinic acid dehydratase [Luminiphilus sp.]MDB2690943.1 delta-aminolevulinic acid dehydratase [Luminiphilus sp.]
MTRQLMPIGSQIRKLFIALVMSVSSPLSSACECLWQGSFSEVAPTADLVVLGTVGRVKGNAIDIDVDVTLTGPDWATAPRVWLKTGDYCRPDVAEFAKGQRFIFALRRLTEVPVDGFNPSTPNLSYGRVGDYALSNCGGYWLRVEGLRASGNLVPGMPRYAQSPKMTPVLIGHITAYLKGWASLDSLIEATKEDPELEALKKDSRSFLRGFSPDEDSER